MNIEEKYNKILKDEEEGYTITMNNDKPYFSQSDFNTIEGIPHYFELDALGRTQGAMALISRNTLSLEFTKKLRYPDPSNWDRIIAQAGFFQRCHCVAYGLSAKQNDMRNIFIGTDELNDKYMKHIEDYIRACISENEDKYIKILYRVTPKYKENNKIAEGILIEAQGINLDFHLCKFCYNVKDKVRFDYKDGRIIKDSRIFSTIYKANASRKENNYVKKRRKTKYLNIYVNRIDNTYHLKDCEKINKVNPKYIVEVTTNRETLLNKRFKTCKFCIKRTTWQ